MEIEVHQTRRLGGCRSRWSPAVSDVGVRGIVHITRRCPADVSGRLGAIYPYSSIATVTFDTDPGCQGQHAEFFRFPREGRVAEFMGHVVCALRTRDAVS